MNVSTDRAMPPAPFFHEDSGAVRFWVLDDSGLYVGATISREELLQQVWGPEYETETNYLRVHLTHLRHKLEPDPKQPRYLRTEPGVGYRFHPSPDT